MDLHNPILGVFPHHEKKEDMTFPRKKMDPPLLIMMDPLILMVMHHLILMVMDPPILMVMDLPILMVMDPPILIMMHHPIRIMMDPPIRLKSLCYHRCVLVNSNILLCVVPILYINNFYLIYT
jgi:hypothetical protein